MIDIKPGTYRLSHPVKNPAPDRRYTSDWRYLPMWEAGWEFVVRGRYRDTDELDLEGLPEEQRERIEARLTYVTIELVGHRWGHHSVGPGHEQWYNTLVKNLEACDESVEQMYTRLGVTNREYFAKWLVETNRLSPAQFEALWAQYEDEGVPEQRDRFVIRDIDANIDRKLVRDLNALEKP